jgi:predicted PurR-regulated permease PerM
VSSHAGAGKALNWTAGLMGGLIETFVLIYMFLVLGEPFFSKLLDGKNPRERERALTIAREIQTTISRYLLTITGINVCLGIAVTAGLWLCGVPNPAIWGVMAMLLNYIPYFGPIAGIIIVGIVSFVTFDSFSRSLLPTGWYLLLHLVEADYLTPVILGKQFTVSPLIVFISLMFAMWLWGGVGALLAAPILISLKVLCQRIPAMAPGNRFL